MNGEDTAKTAEQLARIIAWEMEAQMGVQRPLDQMPILIADSLLDYFDIRVKSDLTLPS